nr:MAG TPA: hypothetical protein [Caudoviricetes sp.]
MLKYFYFFTRKICVTHPQLFTIQAVPQKEVMAWGSLEKTHIRKNRFLPILHKVRLYRLRL